MAIPPGGDTTKVIHDHPLCDGPESAWSTFFKDNEVLLQIDKDVRRLCPDISFFQQVCVDNVLRIKILSWFFSGHRISVSGNRKQRRWAKIAHTRDSVCAQLSECGAKGIGTHKGEHIAFIFVFYQSHFFIYLKKRKRIYQIFSAFVFCL